MKYSSSLYLVGFILLVSCKQVFTQNYFQQKVDFNIKAKLDTIDQILSVDCKISYTNNSSETLNEIYLHLWWNALSDKKSPYASQKLERSSYDFHFANPDQMGGYRNLNVIQNEKKLKVKAFKNNGNPVSDIIIIELDEPCLPGNNISIELKYELDIPYRFSRFGYLDNVYSFTQWYPKPAVYDNTGWHPISYLDIGEFYYDFGDYEVEIDVPEGIQFASTGVISDRRKKNDREIILFSATNVTDFAFFISSDFILEKRNVTIDTRTIQLNIYKRRGNKLWDNAMDYLERALRFFEEYVGHYPYPQISIVDGSDSSSGGMEYPMITIIEHNSSDQVLDHLIAHEIGHNWFYGILASNERDYAWLDEGMNTYFEEAYNQIYYQDPVYEDLLLKTFITEISELDLLSMMVLQLQNANRDLPINTSSPKLDLFNYGAQSYQKMAWALEYLASYLGEDIFQACIKTYFSVWAFRHPDPNAIEDVFENVSGKNLDWFFDDLINSKKRFDYKIGAIETTGDGLRIEIKQSGTLNIPFHISVFDSNDSLLSNQWIAGLDDKESIVTALNVDLNIADRVSINGHVPFLDADRKNNHYYLNRKIFNRNIQRFNFLFKTSDSRYNSINWLPSLMVNGYDGLMTGIQFTNDIFPSRPFRYYFNLAYGLGSGIPVGLFSMEKDFFPSKSSIRKWQMGLYGKQFSSYYYEDLDWHLKYRKIVPHISLHFSKNIRTNHILEYKLHLLETEHLEFGALDQRTVRKELSQIHQLNFNADWHNRLSQNAFKIGFEYHDYETVIEEELYLKLSAEYKSNIAIQTNSSVDLRVFGTYFIHNSQRESASYSNIFTRGSFTLAGLGLNDYLFTDYYFARSDQTGFFSRQINIRDGGFKTSSGNVSNEGKSNDWAIAMNLKSDLPFGFLQYLNIRPFLDLALVSTKSTLSDPLKAEFYYSGGLALEFGDFLGFYIPIINSNAIDQFNEGSSVFSRISFRLNINKLNAWNYLDNPSLLLN